MKKKQIIVGIDVSKSTLDVFVRDAAFHFIVSNNTIGFAELLETICKVSKCKPGEILFCFENTGKYSKMLSVFLHSQGLTFFMEPALAIKRSLGITRGKNDKVDAKRIAEYAYEKNTN
ncbi:MAG: IS110 family transposase [Chloroflexia bacterium]|nr:IS110 family transposase [Chloroflexia bacterium]